MHTRLYASFSRFAWTSCLGLATASWLIAQNTPSTGKNEADPRLQELEKRLDADGLRVLEQLKKVEEATRKTHASMTSSVTPILREAASSDSKAIALWMECAREVDFREKGRKETEFREWKENMEKRLGGPGAGGAIRANLQFLLLAIRAAEAKTASEQAEVRSVLTSFMDGLPSLGKDVLRNPLLRAAVLSTPIARRYKLHAIVQLPKGWPQDPAAVGTAYEEIILPPLREAKDAAKLQAAWQRWIRTEAAIATAKDSPPELKEYQDQRLPLLEWGMARDLFRAGSPYGTNGLLQTIQKYPTNPQINSWIEEVKMLLAERAEQGKADAAPSEPTAQ